MPRSNKVEVSMETATKPDMPALSYVQICKDAAVCADSWDAQSFTIGKVTKTKKSNALGCYRHWVDVTFYRDTVGNELVFIHQ